MFKRILLVFGILLIGLSALAVWLYQRDPLQALPQPEHHLQSERILLARQNGRRVEHIVLRGSAIGEIGFTISLPDPLPAEKLPLLFVLGGLGTGENNISFIKNAGNNAIIGYDWPIPTQFPNGLDFLLDAPDLYRQAMSIPAQAVSMIGWLAEQPWANKQRISLLGFSLGALAVPSIQDMAEHDGHAIGWTIIAYGGAPLGDLFAANPHMKPHWLRDLMAPVVNLLLRPLEPMLHAPHLSGRFLVLEGQDDTLVPEKLRVNLREAVPQPKDVIVFKGSHMGVGPNKFELLQKIIETSRDWLIRNGAVNPA